MTASWHARAEFQTQSEARIQLSRTNEYFPGTSERIMMISGTVNQVLTALHLVLAKMNSEKTVQDTMLARCRRLAPPPVPHIAHHETVSMLCILQVLDRHSMPACLRRDGISQELRLLVPAALCGSIIGKGGATIRSFSEDSKAQIGLSPQVRELCNVPLLMYAGLVLETTCLASG